MSSFLKVLERHQAEIERLLEEQEQGKPVPYRQMRDMGMLRPFAVRLPNPLILVLDEMAKHGLWESKQEMVYDMIRSAYSDFLNTCSDEVRKKFGEIERKAWREWDEKHKGKVFNASTGKYEPRETRREKEKRGTK